MNTSPGYEVREMSESAIERTSRALDLIPFVHQNPGFSIVELAEKFSTTPTQMFKDLEMLFMCGLPGYSHLELIDLEIDEDYVAVKNPQNLNKPRKLSLPEVTALILGLAAIQPLISDAALKEKSLSLQERLSKLISTQHRDQLASFSVKADLVESPFDSLMAQAVAEQKALLISYRSAREEKLTNRTIYPTQSYAAHGYLYSIAFCLLTNEIRHFRHDRIEWAEFSHEDGSNTRRSTQRSSELLQVRVLLSKRNRFFLEEHREIVVEQKVNGENIEAVFELGDADWLLRGLISLPGALEILEPREFTASYYERLDAILALYR
jgi:proteasome accessory factor C